MNSRQTQADMSFQYSVDGDKKESFGASHVKCVSLHLRVVYETSKILHVTFPRRERDWSICEDQERLKKSSAT